MAKKGGLPHTKISKLFFVVSRDLILQLGEGIGWLVETLGLCTRMPWTNWDIENFSKPKKYFLLKSTQNLLKRIIETFF